MFNNISIFLFANHNSPTSPNYSPTSPVYFSGSPASNTPGKMIFFFSIGQYMPKIFHCYFYRFVFVQDQQALAIVHQRCHKIRRIRQHRPQTHTAQPALNKHNEQFPIQLFIAEILVKLGHTIQQNTCGKQNRNEPNHIINYIKKSFKYL